MASVIIAAVFWAGVGNGFVYDDYEVILRQPTPSSPARILRVFEEPHFCDLPYYRPVTRSTLLLQKWLHDESPRPFHLFNVALAVISFLLARAILVLPGLQVRSSVALVGAFLFAVHPVTSTCVYPIASGRETLLPGTLLLGSFYAFAQRDRVSRIVSVLLFGAAIFSKESAVMGLPVMIAAEVLGIGRRAPASERRMRVTPFLPYLLLVVGYFLIRLDMFRGREFVPAILERPLTVVLSFVFALRAFFAPSFELVYEPTVPIWATTPSLIGTALGVGLVVMLAVALTRRGGGPKVWFWGFWFVLLMLPTSNILDQETQYAERYVFPAGLGIVGLIACAVSSIHVSLRARSRLLGTAVIMAGVLAGITVSRAGYYKDSRTFCTQWLQTNPRAVNAHTHMGYLSLQAGELSQAAASFRRALDLEPNHPGALVLLADTRLKEGAAAAAVTLASKALTLDVRSSDARSVLAEALARNGHADEAIIQYRELLASEPRRPDDRFNLAALLFDQGRVGEAIAEFSTLIQEHPDHAAGRANLGRALARDGRYGDAVAQYREALRLNPDDHQTHGNLANVLAVQGNVREARLQYEEVLRLNPGLAEAHYNLAMLAASQRSFAEAHAHFLAARDLKPAWSEPTLRLAWMLATVPDATLRDADGAVRLAEDLCRDTAWSDPASLDVLAAAYAAAGRFDDAVHTAERALGQVDPSGNGSFVASLRRRLRLYESGHAYLEEP